MGKILTVSLPEEIDQAIRRLAVERYGGRKGAIAQVISDAVREKFIDPEQEEITKRALERLRKGFPLGGRTYRSRDELYDRHDRRKR